MVKIRSITIFFVTCILAATASDAQSASWYKRFNGSIDKYAMVMQLHKAGHKYTGYYYYLSSQRPVYFIGDDTTVDGHIQLSAQLPGNEEGEKFAFSISGNKAAGQWRGGGKARALAFIAREDSSGRAFDYIYTEGTTTLRPGLEDSPEASFEAGSVWPRDSSSQGLFLKKLIRDQFEEKNPSEEIGRTFLRLKRQFFSGYLEEYKDLKKEDIQDSYSYNMDQTNELIIAYQSPKLLVLALFNFAYTGGAHGNYGTSYIPIDLVNNKKIELSDVVTESGKKQLSRLLEKSFRKDYAVKDADSLSEGGLFENKIEPNDNFYITARGICFCYVPYEIGPYAMGDINIYIPFTALSAYLQPGIKQLIR